MLGTASASKIKQKFGRVGPVDTYRAMKFIALFLCLLASAASAQEYSAVKSSAYCVDQSNFTLARAKVLKKGDTLKLNDSVEIAVEFEASLHLLLSNGAQMLFEPRTTIYLDNVEQDVGDGTTFNGEDHGTAMNIRLEFGRIHVRLPLVNDSTVVIIQSKGAELEIHSTDFSVETRLLSTGVTIRTGYVVLFDGINKDIRKDGPCTFAVYGEDRRNILVSERVPTPIENQRVDVFSKKMPSIRFDGKVFTFSEFPTGHSLEHP